MRIAPCPARLPRHARSETVRHPASLAAGLFSSVIVTNVETKRQERCRLRDQYSPCEAMRSFDAGIRLQPIGCTNPHPPDIKHIVPRVLDWCGTAISPCFQRDHCGTNPAASRAAAPQGTSWLHTEKRRDQPERNAAMERYEDTLVRLRQLLTDGALRNGERLPPERILANELQVGRRSLRRALGVLEREGQISRQQGR